MREVFLKLIWLHFALVLLLFNEIIDLFDSIWVIFDLLVEMCDLDFGRELCDAIVFCRALHRAVEE